MRILLSGGTGFLGSAFLRRALAAGHTLGALARPERAERLPRHSGLRVLPGTLQDPPWDSIAAFQAEACVHAAWITDPATYLESPVNHQLLEHSREFARGVLARGTARFVALGTCIEYRLSGEPLVEDVTPLAPATTYARCKDELRRAIEAEAARRGASAIWCRVFYPYGAGEHPARLCSSLIRQLARGEQVSLRTPDSTKDYIHVDDLATALLTAVERGATGALNLGTGTGVTVRTIAETIAELLGRPGSIVEAFPRAADPLAHVVADATKLRALGWRPTVSLRDGLSRLVEELPYAAPP